MPETLEYLKILNKALWFTVPTAIFTFTYITFAGFFIYKSAN
jgi:hypothetical protein